AKYYFISWMPIFLGGVITPLLIVGKIEYSFWVRNALLMAVMAEASLMAMALASRLKSNEDQVLYSLTHDHHFGLPNSALMSQVINRKQASRKRALNYMIVVAEIQQYHVFSAYFEGRGLKGMLEKLCSLLESKLSALPLVYIGQNLMGLKYTFLLKGGIIGYVVKGTDIFQVESVLESLSSTFPITYQSDPIHLTLQCHFGISRSIDDSYPERIASKALQAINTAKRSSKLYALYNAQLAKEEQRKITLVSELQRAIEEDKLELYHQPQVTVENNRVRGSEALIRWNHKKLGFIPPDEFIKIAEDTGLIEQLTHWVVVRAYKHLKEIRKAGFEQSISINVSVLDVVNDGLCDFIIKQCAKLDLSPRHIIIEVTETEGIHDHKRFTENLTRIYSAGFNIAIDDYGTGYSSLSYLSSYPIHEIKIDKSLITGVAESERNQLLVNATLSMAKSLKLEVVAEGVEDLGAIEYLRKNQCDIIQGYYFSKPLPLAEYLEWLKTNRLVSR
ncbi:MAG: EAL domain-containing protein, partial [Kangiellaceae bacterium]|nr:EAL domain-containing protein [Kangiellaceae bacterium]